jgi:hypothetical protein
MKNLIATITIIAIGVLLIPALLFLALGLGTTIMAYMLNPKVMLIVAVTLGLINLPGIIIGLIAKR